MLRLKRLVKQSNACLWLEIGKHAGMHMPTLRDGILMEAVTAAFVQKQVWQSPVVCSAPPVLEGEFMRPTGMWETSAPPLPSHTASVITIDRPPLRDGAAISWIRLVTLPNPLGRSSGVGPFY